MRYVYDIHFEKGIQTPRGRNVEDAFVTLEIDKLAYDKWIKCTNSVVYFAEILESQFKNELKYTAIELLRMVSGDEMRGYKLKYMKRNYKEEEKINGKECAIDS